MEKPSLLCQYNRLPDGDIHHIVYHEVSRAATDAFLMLFETLLDDTPADGMVRLIVDNEVNDQPQPLNYMIARLRSLLTARPRRPAVRVAIVYHSRNPLFALIDVLFRSLRRGNDRLRYFLKSDWDAMLVWLKADD